MKISQQNESRDFSDECQSLLNELVYIVSCMAHERIYVHGEGKKFSLAFPVAPGSEKFYVHTRTWRSMHVDFYEDSFEIRSRDNVIGGFERLLLFKPQPGQVGGVSGFITELEESNDVPQQFTNGFDSNYTEKGMILGSFWNVAITKRDYIWFIAGMFIAIWVFDHFSS
ncbi:hypothetical protein JOD55_000208 [Arcanobacterium pluranimalium]|uniref:hypothetical protein n=1 Tax=Arcanobacterium pluranimalium TaxID=108028 RepID=UPI00195C7D7D|nr:hypothetical protein [Arcanobacterium pluranimalium]MBM7824381.1 hypothetical protein [Arcanobacterium pluranimalium]